MIPWVKIGGGVLMFALAGLVVWMFGNARYDDGASSERAEWQSKVKEADQAKLAAYEAGVARGQLAARTFHETIERIQPVTSTIIERTAEYAQTADGAAQCLPVERVRDIEQTRASLFAAASTTDTGRSAGAVQTGHAGEK